LIFCHETAEMRFPPLDPLKNISEMSGDRVCSFSVKEVKKCFDQSETRTAILNFKWLQKLTTLLTNS